MNSLPEKRSKQRPGISLVITAVPRLAVIGSLCLSVWGQQQNRELVSDGFTKNRQKAEPGRTSPAGRPTNRSKRYRLASSSASKQTQTSIEAAAEQLGITLWRLREAKANDKGVRTLVRESDKSSEWIPERVEADTLLRVGDRVRLTVESPRVGFLYVVDQDLFADGTRGDALLIFPATDMRGGDNQVRPGKLIDIPPQENDAYYFTARPRRNDQVGELLTIIVTKTPMNLSIGKHPLPISSSEIAKWEKTWGSESERFEMVGGAGQPWTKEEKAAAAGKSTRQLTREEPPPQTIYRLPSRNSSGVLVSVRLAYRK